MSDTQKGLPLRRGSECRIEGLGQEGKIAQRLAQMGIVPGCRLQVVRLAPLGDTVEVSVDGGQAIALRGSDLTTLDCQIIAMPLSTAFQQAVSYYRIANLLGGRTFHQRMRKLGIVPGAELLVTGRSSWPLQIEILPAKQPCSLGQGEAEKVIVKPLHIATRT